MAAEQSTMDRNQFTCGICMDYYTIPRYLPTCGHTFCEKCLLTFASNLQEQGGTLECPVCGKSHCSLENNQVTLEWIQTFPLNSFIINMLESGSEPAEQKNTGAAQMRRGCDPCKERGVTVVGLQFCLDCQEVYCKICANSHKAFKMSRCHRLVDIGDISAEVRRADFFASFTKCPNHPEKDIELYCQDHVAVMCAVCAVSDHDKACNTIDMSSQDVDAAKLRSKAENLTSQMHAAVDHLNLLQILRKERKRSFKTNLKDIREEMKQVRDQTVKLMNKAVSHVTAVTKQLELETEDRLDDDMSRISKLKEQTEEKIALMATIEQHGSDRHKLISVHLMKTQLEETGRKIPEEDKNLKYIKAELKIADDIRKVIENAADVEKLVQVEVYESESDHKHLGTVRNYLRDSKLVRVEEHIVRPNAGHSPWFNMVSMLKDGRIILSDLCNDTGCGYLCVYNAANKTMLNLKLSRPYSATQIDDTHLAVSVPTDNVIILVKVENELSVEAIFKPQFQPGSVVALNNNQLAVAWTEPPAFSVIEISGTDLFLESFLDRDKSGRKFKTFNHLAVNEKRRHVIQPCNQDSAVYCFDFTGAPIFKYTNPTLGYPMGVALDKCGNIYVCEYMRDSIHKLSPAGELISIFTAGVPSCPLAICCDNTGTGFWVTQLKSSQDTVVHFRLEQDT